MNDYSTHMCYIPACKGVVLGNRYQCSCGNMFEYRMEFKPMGVVKFGWANLGKYCRHKIPMSTCFFCSGKVNDPMFKIYKDEEMSNG